MRLLVIRHGESEADILRVCEGRADFGLTERGHRQAEAMGSYVGQNYQIDKIYCSTLKRAVQTAEHLGAKVGLPLILDGHLMEFNNGLLAGLEYSVAEKKYPRVEMPLHSAVYEQESALDFRYRAEYMLSKLTSEHEEDSTIAVLTHGGMINQLYRAFFRLPVDSKFGFQTGDTGIHEWVISKESRVVVRANYIPHSI